MGAPYAASGRDAEAPVKIMPVTNPLERLNAEIKRRTNVVGIFPNDAAITRLVGAMLLEQNDEWCLNRRYMQLEGLQSLCDTAPARLSAIQR
jgi:putative transposase